MIEKTDDALGGINDLLRSLADRITPSTILIITIVNGFALGLLTTGFLGDKSIGVSSLSFALFIWQFLVIFVLSSRHIDLSTTFMNKFVVSGMFGFVWQWQAFGMIAKNFYPGMTSIEPLMDHPLIVFMFGYLTIMILVGYCFKGNIKTIKQNKYDLKANNAA
jgi:hypothetical protein